ncbi:MAG: hypothetical protein KDA45_00800, partial [Planctomycetales bacterium]|nr:hypothetical protein [Planctomycetales bacterium]
MRRQHFDALRPVCPVCKTGLGQLHPLKLAEVSREHEQHIIEGVLHCSHANCQREYPILD